MTKSLLLLFACLSLCAAAFGWEALQINDYGTVFHEGAADWTVRNPQLMAGYRTSMGVSCFACIHGSVPDNYASIEAILISPLRFEQMIPQCSEEDTVSFRVEFTWAQYPTQIDSIRDRTSPVFARSPVVHVPYSGITSRRFYSSGLRPQNNGWDSLFVFFHNAVYYHDHFILRFVSIDSSGVGIALSEPPHIYVSTNLAAETDGIDWGSPTTVRYLPPDSSYEGLVMRGNYHRPWGHDLTVPVRVWNPNGSLIGIRNLALPADENCVSGTFRLAIESATPAEIFQVGDSSDCGVDTTATLYWNGRP